MCHSLGGVPCKLLTITENIHFNLAYFDMITMYHKKEARDRFMIKDSLKKMTDEMKATKITKLLDKRKLNIEHMRQQTRTQIGKQMTGETDQDIGIETRFLQHLMIHEHKKAIIITSRVHPGETQSSWAMDGMIKFLVSNHPEAQQLRKQYIFYIVPMLNPDGVIHGNHRTDLTGFDMNRKWGDPSPYLHPTLYAVRQLVKMI